MKKTHVLSVLLVLAPIIIADDLYVVKAPEDAIAFSKEVTSLKSSQLGALLRTASGVTPSKSSFDGLRVLSPFRYPRVISLITVAADEGSRPAADWRHFDVKGSADAEEAFHQLDKGLSKQPRTLPAIKLQTEEAVEEGADAALNGSASVEQRLQQEVSLLDTASERMATQLEGRRAVLVSLQSLAEAPLWEAVERYADRLSAASGGRALTLLLTQPAHVRRARSLLAEEAEPTKMSLNLAGSYTGDYPVIFNILLITSLFLVYVLVSFSVMTAYMDPGKDSIIYRMTNPNMKKNN